jgi:hypothetical protein
MHVPARCDRCGELLDGAAGACPRCGAATPAATATASTGRRPAAAGGIVTGALVIVAALVVGLLVAGGGGNASATHRRERAARYPDPSASTTTVPAAPPIDSSSLDATMLEPADLGPGWSSNLPEMLEPGDRGGEDCSSIPPLDGDAVAGRTVHLEQDAPDGQETAVVRVRVRVFATVDEAAGRMAAQASPAFVPCVQDADVISTECSCRTTATPVPLGVVADPPLPGVAAVLFHDAVTFVSADGPGTWYLRRAYFQRGRVTLSVVAEGASEMAQPQWETLVRTIADRMTRYLPAA